MKKFTTIIFVLALATSLYGQISRLEREQARSNEGGVIMFNFSYGAQLPGGDMADRFGRNAVAGVSMDYFTMNNWILGAQGDFMFGKTVKTDVLANLRNSQGFVFSDGGDLADVQLRERGLLFSLHFGRVFAFSEHNKRSGLRVTVGAGMFQHKIRIQDAPQSYVSGLSDSYKKGYDRLANGLALTQFIGYQYVANNRLVNISAGVELVQGFTEGRRNFNFDTRTPGLEKRVDLLHGFRLTWTLPLFVGENPDEINY